MNERVGEGSGGEGEKRRGGDSERGEWKKGRVGEEESGTRGEV